MSSIREQLEESQKVCSNAWPGPWAVEHTGDDMKLTAVGNVPFVLVDNDEYHGPVEELEFIAHARTELPMRNAQLAAVLELHKPVEIEPSDTICDECSYRLPNGRYLGKVEEYPCPTVRAIEGGA